MRYRPIDRDPDDPRLGRFIPDDWEHVERYPLTALSAEEQPARVPVVIGVNWYSEFDNPRAGWRVRRVLRCPRRSGLLDKGARWPLRLPRARWRARPRGLVGLLRPGS